ncbi:LytR/AlgR family response regulator transcription factor [Riemerella columbipharyngis]|uniref:DNA-binding response regulator, LytR/AlgR family n=1 Tax=Riemerella columbipharyngis TaxID=1071918 RepID=A0A1G7FQQ2_9FLAO|nr:LytTR family transcriptional regulator DNA-binding domain-containing protein [Riemerella columbipharyngis]SDE78260.1 DNA-binding response regulator, LytR/AlgR family [Riemerella columbipharyngis]
MVKCIVIDDEQPAIDIMKHHIGKVPELELIGAYLNPIDGLKAIKKEKPDLVFLDIQINEMTGLEVMNILDDKIKVILCTAFSEYAVEGFNNDAVDYLLKPISFERFTKAIKKVVANLEQVNTNSIKEQDYIYTKTEQKGKFIKIHFQDIDYVEAMGNYISINRGKEKVMIYYTMKDMERILPKEMFMRIHKSYIVSLPNILMVENGFVVLKNGAKISIGANYKNDFMQRIKKNIL